MAGKPTSASGVEADAAQAEIAAALAAAGLVPAGVRPRFVALAGGVASDIWKVEGGTRPLVVKRALPKLRVAAEWLAPVSRNASEAAWFRSVRAIVPEAVPEVLYHDPQTRPVCDAVPAAGALSGLEGAAARRPGRSRLRRAGRAHHRRASTRRRWTMRASPRVSPTTPPSTPSVSSPTWRRRRTAIPASGDALMALSRSTLACHQALVHGDVSPKNILAGPNGPVLLDAECAVYGDPAFDLAFCLNHLLLKCLWNRAAAPRFLAAFDALCAAYFEAFQPALRPALRDETEARAARLLPALLLARVDGKSPVEYIATDAERDLVRATAIPLVATPPARLAAMRAAWAEALHLEDARTPGSS